MGVWLIQGGPGQHNADAMIAHEAEEAEMFDDGEDDEGDDGIDEEEEDEEEEGDDAMFEGAGNSELLHGIQIFGSQDLLLCCINCSI